MTLTGLVSALPDTPAPDPSAGVTVLLQYGALGAIVIFLGWFSWSAVRFLGRLAWSAIERERLRADTAEADLHKLNESFRTEVIPVLTRATEAIVRVSEVLPDTGSARRERRS